jgi:hypothetical protein
LRTRLAALTRRSWRPGLPRRTRRTGGTERDLERIAVRRLVATRDDQEVRARARTGRQRRDDRGFAGRQHVEAFASEHYGEPLPPAPPVPIPLVVARPIADEVAPFDGQRLLIDVGFRAEDHEAARVPVAVPRLEHPPRQDRERAERTGRGPSVPEAALYPSSFHVPLPSFVRGGDVDGRRRLEPARRVGAPLTFAVPAETGRAPAL